MITIAYPNSYWKYRRRLSSERGNAVTEALVTFVNNPKTRALNFEPVTHRKGFFTIRSTSGDRILFRKIGAEAFEAVAVGNHDLIYFSYFKK